MKTTAFNKVKQILEMYPQARNSYNDLVRTYLYYLCEGMWSKLPSVETICRAYRNVIKAYPQLGPDEETAKHRNHEYDKAVISHGSSIVNREVNTDLVFQ